MTNLEVIIQNLLRLKEQGEDKKDDTFWQDENGCDLTDMISCHPVFSDSTPCLNDIRNAEYNSSQYRDNCNECKANWLLEEYQ